MRSVAFVACLTMLAACGSSTSKGLNVAPTMTVGGVAFVPADGAAVTVTNKSCTLPVVGPTSVSGLMVGFSSYGGLCDFTKNNGVSCVAKENSKLGSIIISRVGQSAPGAIGPGTYAIGLTGDPSFLTAVTVAFEETDAACQSTSPVVGASGTVTITQVTPTVKGTLAVTLDDGAGSPVGSFSGAFDVSACDYQVDICALATPSSCTTPACIP